MSDFPEPEYRRHLHQVADLIADYLAGVERYPVLPRLRPGELRARLPESPPEEPEPLEAILADYRELIEPNVTHWNHPGFLAYFATSGSVPGILGEALAAGLNVQAMLWRTGPAATELEQHVCDWLRRLVGLPADFSGHINDTASSSSLIALASARHRAWPDSRAAGVRSAPPLRVYASEHAHSSIDKACITLGMGIDSVVKVAADERYAMRPDALEAAIAADRAAGRLPVAVVATIGTTSSTAIDPVAAVAHVARAEGLWLHIDAAYAGPAAACPELRSHFAGWELADSIVLNPHKWLFTPMDCSVLLVRDPDAVRAAFNLTPEYLRTAEAGALNLSEFGPQLGRRFRALKLWFVLRAYGAAGLRERLREHCALAREFAGWVDAEPGFERCAPVPFSVVCFRAVPAGRSGEEADRFNEKLLAAVNDAGPVFLSHTRLGGRIVLRVAIGNIRTGRDHVRAAWDLVRARAVEMGL
ncbi:MAG TPA: pyridoxal-dependent decarboxylase [Gemmatimonadales bacterium]|nr:pyridoxal-dependent decarboxylase [Gemmatimonadales bacterium]